jgi:hypothetical protein
MIGLFGGQAYEKLWHVGCCYECGKRHRGKLLGDRFYCFRCLGKIRRTKKEVKKLAVGWYQLKLNFGDRQDSF